MTKDRFFILVDRSIEYLLYAMIFFMPIAKASIAIIFGFIFLLFIIKKFLRPEFKFLFNLPHIFLLLFFLFSAISLINSGELIYKSLVALFGKWLMRIIIFVIIEDTLNTPRRLKRAILVLIFISSLVSIDAIYQYFMGRDFLRARLLVGGSPTAGFENQNSLGAYLAPILILVGILSFSKNAISKYKALLATLSLVICVVLFLTFSRSAWLAVLFGISLFLLLSLGLRKALLALLISVVILISVPQISNRFVRGNYKDRLALMETSFAMIKDKPFLGLGLGTYMDHFQDYATIKGVYYAHNSYLQIWAESGFFSLLSILMFMGAIIYNSLLILKKNRDYLLLGLVCLTGTLLFHAFFEVHLYSLQLATFFWFMLGLLSAANRVFSKNEPGICLT